MNRSERRWAEIKNKEPKEQVMQKYRQEAYDGGFKAGMESTIDITFYMTAYTLSYKLDLSKQEIQDLMRAIYNNIDSYRTGHLEPQDYNTIVEQMNNEYGIKIK